MEPQQTALLIEIAIESSVYALIIFSLMALGVGTILFIAPQKIVRLRALSDRWLTPRKPLKSLEVPRNSDPFLYRYHRWIGGVAIVLPIITLYILIYSVADELPQNMVTRREHYLFWQWLFESATLFLWITNIFAFVVYVAF